MCIYVVIRPKGGCPSVLASLSRWIPLPWDLKIFQGGPVARPVAAPSQSGALGARLAPAQEPGASLRIWLFSDGL